MQMKNKILASLTVLCAALVLVGGFSVTAYAQTPTEETDDSGVIVETEPQPLTPEGNMTLVDDIDGDAAEDKQFIVVKSKGGNYFYIIVDRAAEGENSVHFLNQVDESDLMAIIGEEQTEQPPAVCNCTEKCKAGEVNTLSLFFITLANPAFILIFVALFAAWGISYDGIGFTDGMIMILGVLGGASLWWFTLTFCVSLLRKKFRPRHLLWINRVTGAVIVVLGAVAILSIFIQIQVPVHGVLPPQ